MIYDTLFGLDANFTPQPQMVVKWGVSDDKLTYTFELREGLKFSDGAAGDRGGLRRLGAPLGVRAAAPARR